jgi:hypothetical protein
MNTMAARSPLDGLPGGCRGDAPPAWGPRQAIGFFSLASSSAASTHLLPSPGTSRPRDRRGHDPRSVPALRLAFPPNCPAAASRRRGFL